VLKWQTPCFGADIHRPVLRDRAEQVDANPDADHPRTVCLSRRVRHSNSSWNSQRRGVGGGGAGGRGASGGGEGGCGVGGGGTGGCGGERRLK